jgi:site-specific DNA-methyltransferase (adenine-specific)
LTSIVKRYGGPNAKATTAGVYGRSAAGFMGQRWDTGETAFDWRFWREVLRVLKPGGYLIAASGTRTYHHLAMAIEDAGFELRDMISWLYGSGFPKSHNHMIDGEKWGTALKPACEPWVLARKPLIGSVAANIAEHGTGAMNIDGCRIPTDESLNGGAYSDGGRAALPGDARTGAAAGMFAEGGGRLPGQFAQPEGRWPANVIHDASPEVEAAFAVYGERGASAPVRGSEPSAVTAGIYGQFNARVPGAFHGDSGTAARFFYGAKASRSDRDEGCEHLASQMAGMRSENSVQHITRRDDDYDPQPVKNNHPTVKPTDLMAYLCRLVTPKGGLVLDPFMGSGSTGKAAMIEGFRFIGIERDPHYMSIAHARVEFGWQKRLADTAQGNLFGDL